MGSWGDGVHGSWTGRMMDWGGGGGSWYFGRGPKLKTKGGPSPIFFVLWKFTCSKKKILGSGGARAPFGINVGPSLLSEYLIIFDALCPLLVVTGYFSMLIKTFTDSRTLRRPLRLIANFSHKSTSWQSKYWKTNKNEDSFTSWSTP